MRLHFTVHASPHIPALLPRRVRLAARPPRLLPGVPRVLDVELELVPADLYVRRRPLSLARLCSNFYRQHRYLCGFYDDKKRQFGCENKDFILTF